jgi:hypothetical protein
MPEVLRMKDLRMLVAIVSFLLNATDLLLAFFLVLGGWNMTNSHALIGYACMASGPLLLYLSFGIWTNENWKLVARIVLYAGAFLALAISATVLISVHAFPSVDGFVVYAVVAALFLATLLSIVHFRLVKRETVASLHNGPVAEP